MPIARPLLKYGRLKSRITSPGGGMYASRVTDPTPIVLSVEICAGLRGRFES